MKLKRSFYEVIPGVKELNDDLKPMKHYYLGDEEKIRKAIESVVVQGKAKSIVFQAG